MLFLALANAAVFCATLWLIGGAIARIVRWPGTPAESLALYPALGLLAGGAMVALMLLFRLGNADGAVAFWLVAAGSAALAKPWRNGLDATARRYLGWYALFVVAQVAFIALPDIATLDVGRQMGRGIGRPLDAWLPFRFAEMVTLRLDPEKQAILTDWRLSDRGPLLGLAVSLDRIALGARSYPSFVALGVAANSFFLLPCFLLLERATGSWRAGRLFFVLVAADAFVSMNVWFTWPKLMATGCFLLALYYAERRRPAEAGLFSAGALLGHIVTTFYVPLLAARYLWRAVRQRTASELGRFAATLALGYLPWGLYKHFWHPDTERLVKWHVFGHIPPTDRALAEVARSYLATHGFGDLVAIRWSNLLFPFQAGSLWSGLREAAGGQLCAAGAHLWSFSFYHLLGALDPFLVAALVAIAARRPHVLRVTSLVWATAIFLFAATVFGLPSNSLNHQWAFASLLLVLLWASPLLDGEARVVRGGVLTLFIAYELAVLYGQLPCSRDWPHLKLLSTEAGVVAGCWVLLGRLAVQAICAPPAGRSVSIDP